MTEPTENPKSATKRQGRSPAYPGLPLKIALQRAKAQYDAEGKYAIPLPSAFKAWGYSDKSSGGRDTRASLRYFGLITVDGDGDSAKVKLTEDALRVLLDEREDETEKKAIIRRLALNPSAHKKLWAKFPDGIKSDATASHYLVFDEGYNKTAADALIAEFKETAGFAGLYEPGTMSVISEPDADGSERPEESGAAAIAKGIQPPPRDPPPPNPKVTVMEGERVALIEESKPGQYLKLIASGEVDSTMLEALEDFVKRQRKRLGAQTVSESKG
ncbi:MAG: hypothetical protein U1E56_11400 [Bauldia sp.]